MEAVAQRKKSYVEGKNDDEGRGNKRKLEPKWMVTMRRKTRVEKARVGERDRDCGKVNDLWKS